MPERGSRYKKMNANFTIDLKMPKPADYIKIRKACGFGEVSLKQSRIGLTHSLFHISIYSSEKLIGFGRIVGDGILTFYIADVLVSPEFFGRGIGRLIMAQLLAYLEKAASPLATIAILTAPNKEGFYAKFGFKTCPNEYFGKGMSYLKFVDLEVKVYR